jgi:hypothetical protein
VPLPHTASHTHALCSLSGQGARSLLLPATPPDLPYMLHNASRLIMLSSLPPRCRGVKLGWSGQLRVGVSTPCAPPTQLQLGHRLPYDMVHRVAPVAQLSAAPGRLPLSRSTSSPQPQLSQQPRDRATQATAAAAAAFAAFAPSGVPQRVVPQWCPSFSSPQRRMAVRAHAAAADAAPVPTGPASGRKLAFLFFLWCAASLLLPRLLESI